MIKSIQPVVGTVTLYHVRDNVVIDTIDANNLVVSSGKAFIAQSLIKTTNSPVAMTHIGIGTSNVPTTLSDTTINQAGTRVALSASVNNNIVTYNATFAAGNGTGTITEAGIFNSDTAGTMLSRVVFNPGIQKQAGDIIIINWNITFI